MNTLKRLVLFISVALIGGLVANAQPVTTLYSFVRGPINPHAGLTLGPDGNFYGTTAGGGRNLAGTVFRMTTNGALTTLSSFNGYPSGSGPTADLTLGPDGNFYGTTVSGGTTLSGVNDTGVVFKMTTNGIPTTLVNFNGTNGGHPDAALTLGPDGYYYGTTEFSGSNNVGTVFKVTTNGALTTLVTFNNTNGANPVSCLTLAPGGTFYGTTKFGGQFGLGTAFKLTTNGDFTMLNSFDQTNGAWPAGRMALGPDGNLYGTTAYIGTAFEMTTNGAVTTLYYFDNSNGTNGQFPYSGLTLGPDGNFYGTTSQGGTNGSGTIFQISTNGTLAMLALIPGIQFQTATNPQGVVYVNFTTNNWVTSASARVFNGTLTTLYSFSALVNSDNGDGADPESDLTLGPDGNFYGTTVGGGTNGAGAVFKISPNGTFTALASFAGNTGYNPYAGVTAGPGGSLYGVVKSGGTTGYGTAYKVSAAGQFTLLHNFSYFPDGANPQATLIQGRDGNFYGTAVGGGTNLLQTGPGSFQAESFGTVFELATNGIFTPLAYFNGTNGANPYGGLAFGLDGNFYGTTAYGGISNNGVVFQLLTNGTLTALTNFTGANGANPYAGLTLGLDGNFYGTCEAGGTNGNGTVFQVTTNGALTILVYFNGTNGANSNAGLTLGPDGSFYGTTYGANFGHRGTVFKVTTGGVLTTLVNFAQTNGSGPVGGLALGPDGNFYGTTSLGGVNNYQGTLFKITTNGTLTTLYSFAIPNGSAPFTTLTLQTNSHFINFYGTTLGDGGDHPGTVFRVNLTTSYSIAENTAQTFSPLTNEVVWTTGGVLGLLTAIATNGTAQISGSGIGFTPTTNFTGTATINYTVTDNVGGTNASFITILVTNIPPAANPDFYAVAENSSANVFSPLTNDFTETSGGVLSLVSVSPTNGTAVISGTNVLFTPQANFTGTATIGYTITDNVGGTNSSLITVTVSSPLADLNLSASASPEPAGVGSNLVYSLTVSNAGPSMATGAVVSNQLPANVTFVSATGGATPTNGLLLVNLGSLTEGTSTSVQVVVQPTAAGSLTNSFQVFANEFDPNVTNNSATVVSTVTNAAVAAGDLVLSLSSQAPVPALFGEFLQYVLTVSNAGPAMATGVVVTNQLPASVTFGGVAMSLSNMPVSSVRFANLGSLVAGATVSTTFFVLPPGPVRLTNLFRVFANETDPVPTNNSVTVINGVTNALPAGYPGTPYAGTWNPPGDGQTVIVGISAGNEILPVQTSIISYQQLAPTNAPQATNAIPGDIVLLLNAGGGNNPTNWAAVLRFFNPTDPTGSNHLAATEDQAFFPASAGSAGFTGFSLFSNVVYFPSTTDPSGNLTHVYTDVGLPTAGILGGQAAQFILVVSNSLADLNLSASAVPEPVGVGSNLVYSITVANRGAATASGVTVSNRIPAGVTFVSATGGATPSSGSLLVNLGSLTNGAVGSAQVVVQPVTPGQLTNFFQVFADQTDPVLTNNSARVVSTIKNGSGVISGMFYNEFALGTNSFALAINSSGQIVGQVGNYLAGSFLPIFLTNYAAVPVIMNTLTPGGQGQCLGMNDLGQIVGNAGDHAAYWTNYQSMPVDLATSGGSIDTNSSSTAVAINGAGQIVGGATFTNTFSHAAYWPSSSSAAVDLGALADNANFSDAFSINSSGQIVGYSEEAGGNRATYWTNGQSAPLDLGTLGGSESYAFAINDAGEIVGVASTADGRSLAAYWTNASSPAVALAPFCSDTDGFAFAINNLGQIIGYALSGTNIQESTAVIWQSHSSQPVELTTLILSNAPGVNLSASDYRPAINNSGKILMLGTANGTLTNVENFVLVPTNATIPALADLNLSASAEAEPVGVGSNLVYSLTISNAGPMAASGVVISNQLPTGVNFVSATGDATTLGSTLALNFCSLAAGATRLIQVVVQPTTAGQLTNTFQVFADQTDPVLTNNLAMVVSTVTNAAVAVAPAIPGTPIAWTNPGGSVVVTYTFGFAGNPVPIQTGAGTLNPASTGQAGDLVLLINTNRTTAPSNWAAVVRFYNPADPTGSQGLAATYEQTFFATNFGGSGFNGYQLLPVTSFIPEGTVTTNANGLTTFDTTYTQFGPIGGILTGQTEIDGVSLFTLTSAVNITSPTNMQVVSNAALTVNGTTTNFIFTGFNLTAALTNVLVQLNGGGWTNATTVNGWTNWTANMTLTPGSNTVSAYAVNGYGSFSPTNSVTFDYSTGASPQADLSLGVSGPVTAGLVDPLVYNLTVTNLGPNTASGVVVSNQLLVGFAFVSATGGATPTNGLLLMNLGSLATGQVTNVTITIDSTNSGLGFFTNVFQVSANEADPVPANNSVTFITQLLQPTTEFSTSTAEYDTTNTTIVSQQLTNYSTQLIAKLPDGTVVYDQTFSAAIADPTVQAAIAAAALDLTNAGAAAYSGPAETGFLQTTNHSSVTVPVNTNLATIVGTKQWVGPVTFLAGNFGVISGYTFDPVVTNYCIPIGGNSNSFTLSAGQTDFDTMILSLFDFFLTTTNTSIYTNAAVYTMTGIVAQADLKLTASAVPEPVGVGSNLVYSISIANLGPNAASGVTVSNRIPVGVTFVSATGGATPSSGILLVNLGSLTNGAVSSAQVIVQPTAAGKLTNVFRVFANETDPVLANNSATVITTVTNPPAPPVDVALSLTAAPSPVGVGAPLTYSLTVTNNSSTTATGVVVSNTLPPGVTLFSLLPSQGAVTNQSGRVIYSVGSLPNGNAATLAIVVLPNAAGLLTNTAVVASAQTDSQPANNFATNVTTAVIVPITNVEVSVLTPMTLNPQTGLFEQSIEVANGGPETPSSVLVLVSGLAGNATLYNAAGKTNGLPYVQSASPLGIGSNVVFLLEFYVPTRVAPTNLTYTVEAGPPFIPPVVSGRISSIGRTMVLPNGNVLVEFSAVPGQVYAVQYSSDMQTWLTAVPAITAPASRVQWIDAGPPQTVSNPASQPARYYRVVLLTAH